MNDLGNQYALAALRDRRADLVCEIRHLEKQARTARETVAHLDATLLALNPKNFRQDDRGRPIARITGYFGYKEIPRLCMDVLRQSEHPMTVRELAKNIIARKGLERSNALDGLVYTRVAQLMRSGLRRGVVKRGDRGVAAEWSVS